MGLGGVREREAPRDRDLDQAAPDHVEQLAGARDELVALGDIAAEPGARAISAFSSVPTVPITVAPRCFAH